MVPFRVKTYMLRLYLAVFVLFIANKFGIRPLVLDREWLEIIKIIVLSIPNTFEAIIGLGNVAGLFIAAKCYFNPRFDSIPNRVIYGVALLVAGTYVLTQEFKVHNLGGANVYDPYDVVASLIGLVGMFVVLLRFGIVEPVSSTS